MVCVKWRGVWVWLRGEEGFCTHACASPHALPLKAPCTDWCHQLLEMVK